MNSSITLRPRATEKAYQLSETLNTFVFEVPAGTNKHEVKQAVEKQYKVTVLGVNMTNIKGKAKRSFRKRGRWTVGRDRDVKKAYVLLKQGDKLPIFAATEEATKPEPAKAKKEAK